MTESGILSRVHLRTQYADELVERWKEDHDDAMFAFDVEEAVRACLAICKLMPWGVDNLWDHLYANKVQNHEEAGQKVVHCLDVALQTFERVRESIQKGIENGFKIEGAAEMEGAIHQLQEMKTTFLKRWPRIDSELYEASVAAIARGEVQSVEEILDELQAPDS